MTGKEIVRVAVGDDAFDFTWSAALVEMIDAAIADERARCTAVIWEHRGKCASDQAAKSLMEEMERTP